MVQMWLFVKRLLISFFGVKYPLAMLKSRPIEYFEATHFFADRTMHLLCLSRVPVALAVFVHNDLAKFVVTFRLTQTAVKQVFYMLIAFNCLLIPILRHFTFRLILANPTRWTHFLKLYQIEPPAATARKRRPNANRRVQQIIFRITAVASINFNLFTFVVELFSFHNTIRGRFSWHWLPLQLLSVVQFKYAFNCISSWGGLIPMMFVTSTLNFRNQNEKLIHRLLLIHHRLTLGECRSSELCKPSPLTTTQSMRQFSLAFSRLTYHFQFATRLLAAQIGGIFFCASGFSVGYMYLVPFDSSLVVSRYYLLLAFAAVAIPFVFPFCFFGQMLINQVSDSLVIHNLKFDSIGLTLFRL
jgi:hypothetical protein